MANVRYVRYNNKRGFVVRGGPEVQPSGADSHMARSFYLVSQLEAANWGTVQNYDGAGMSAGPIHVVAVLPSSMSQGALWKMLRNIFDASSAVPVQLLHRKLASLGWEIDERGVLRDSSGNAVPGAALREELSGPNGVVPESGPVHDRAKNWALLFHGTFTDPSSYPAQYESAVDWLTGNFDAEADAYRKYVPGLTGSDADVKRWVRNATMQQVGPYLDLAMAAYHAFSVRAPSPVRNALNRVLAQNIGNVRDFAKTLTRELERLPLDKWDVRARRIKATIARSGLWPEAVVEDVYPDAQAASMRQYAEDAGEAASENASSLFGGLVVLLAFGAAGYFMFWKDRKRLGE